MGEVDTQALARLLSLRLADRPLARDDMQALLASAGVGFGLMGSRVNFGVVDFGAMDSGKRESDAIDSHSVESRAIASKAESMEQDLTLELLRAQGFPLESTQDSTYYLTTTTTPYTKQRFCFVDIETTGAKPKNSQIIEIGAIAYENGQITGRFEEFIYAESVPEIITEITGITSAMLRHARGVKEVLQDFRVFLGSDVFVAHNVGFDYSFVSHALESCSLGVLLNPRLCTIDLARQCILSKRYSLQYLNQSLGINTPTAHRAYADALTALEVFKISCHCLPRTIHTTQDLIDFSKKSLPKPRISQRPAKATRTQ